MNIEIIRSVEEADKATGLAVVIDVFRAFSVEAYIFANGASKIIPVLNLEEAYLLKRENPDYILIGEREGVKPEGFDFGNSPTEILDINFSGKTIVHTTSNGTKGLMNTTNADTVLTGSFLIVNSIIKYIKQNNFQNVYLISTAPVPEEDSEDIILAFYIRDILNGVEVDESKIKKTMRTTSAYSFLRNEAGVPETDFDLCLDFNRFDFVIKKVNDSGQFYLIKENV